jgi:hypothetical protein
MKRYLRPLYSSSLGVALRNLVGFRPPLFLLENEKSYLASDLFVWRTDRGYSTIFKASDTLKKFYGEDSALLLFFFDQHGREIFSKTLHFNNGIAELTVDAGLMETESLGTFCAFNILINQSDKQIKATNRCYVGYGKRGSFSMVHGNLIALYTSEFLGFKSIDTVSINPAVSSRKGKYKYYLQKPNSKFFKNRLIFANPLDRDIRVSVSGNTFHLGSRCCKAIKVSKDEELTVIESDFIFPRPLVFSENKDFVDVHHG